MLYDRKRMLDFAAELTSRKLDIIWSARARVDSVSFRKIHGEPDVELMSKDAKDRVQLMDSFEGEDHYTTLSTGVLGLSRKKQRAL